VERGLEAEVRGREEAEGLIMTAFYSAARHKFRKGSGIPDPFLCNGR
jgi:hypothetical protein